MFPVYGPSSFMDTFGALRGDISSGWHHGDDIFAPLGAPLLAVASGNRLLRRLEQDRRQPPLAPRRSGKPLLLRASLRVLAARSQREQGERGRRRRLRRQHRRRAGNAFPSRTSKSIPSACSGSVTTAQSTRPRTSLRGSTSRTSALRAATRGRRCTHSGTRRSPGRSCLTATDISTADGLVPGSLQRAIRPLIVKGRQLQLEEAEEAPSSSWGSSSRPGR